MSISTRESILSALETNIPIILRLTPYTAGSLLRCIHFAFPAIFISVLIYGNHLARIGSIFILMGIMALFYASGGCLLTMLENRLCGDKFTVIDPLMEWLHIPINTRNRKSTTYAFMCANLIGGVAFLWMTYKE
jgi:hypothetical protein